MSLTIFLEVYQQRSKTCQSALKVNKIKTFAFAINVDPDEVAHNEPPHYEPPHLDLHCLLLCLNSQHNRLGKILFYILQG